MDDIEKFVSTLESRTATWTDIVQGLYPGLPPAYAEAEVLDALRNVLHNAYIDPQAQRDMEAQLAAKVEAASAEATQECQAEIAEHLVDLRGQVARMQEWRVAEIESPGQTRRDLAACDAPNASIKDLDSVIAAIQTIIKRLESVKVKLDFDVELDELRA